MLKVTIKFTGGLLLLFFLSCNAGNNRKNPEIDTLVADSVSEARIDSAYRAITDSCDSFFVHKVPRLVEMLEHQDSSAVKRLIDTPALFKDANKKIEKVIRQLKADCDSNLLKETYRRWLFLQQAKQKLYKKRKALPFLQHSG